MDPMGLSKSIETRYKCKRNKCKNESRRVIDKSRIKVTQKKSDFVELNKVLN